MANAPERETLMAFQDKFWKKSNRDHIRPNPEAPPMKDGPPPFDGDLPMGANTPSLGSSQPKGSSKSSGELPLKHANVKPRRHQQMRQVLMAHALRMHSGADGTTMGTAVGGGAAGGGAGS